MPRRGDPSGRVFVSTLQPTIRLSRLFRETISERLVKGFLTTHCKCCKLDFSTLKRSIVTHLSVKLELALCRGLEVVLLLLLVTMGRPEPER